MSARMDRDDGLLIYGGFAAAGIPLGIYHWPVINLAMAGVLAIGLVTERRLGGGADSRPHISFSADGRERGAGPLAPAMLERH